MQYTLTPRHVQHHATDLLSRHLRLQDYGRKCPARTLLAVTFAAACRLCSLAAACAAFVWVPCYQTLRKALLANLPDTDTLERRLNDALAELLPPHRRRRRRQLAIDLHLIPYHGKHHQSPDELVRGKAKAGTTHFHAYATAYLAVHGQRVTVAMTYVRDGEQLQDVLKRLLRRCAAVGVRAGLLLLDRGFWSVGVIRYLQAARYPFLMPVIARGRKAGHAEGPSGTRVFFAWRQGGFGHYTLREGGGRRRSARVSVCVHVRNRNGRRGLRGRECLVYAYWGWRPPGCPGAVSERYRKRFGIESSYRQLGQGRPRTSSRRPEVRLFLVGVGLVLRNVWVWLHHEVLSARRRGRRRYRWGLLRLKRLLLMLLHAAEKLLGIKDEVPCQRPIPLELAPEGMEDELGNY